MPVHSQDVRIGIAIVILASACGTPVTPPTELWFDSPVDGTLALLDHEPPPY
jgi:hypothetical protein